MDLSGSLMMAELKPLKEFLDIELWQYEDGEIGWKMTSNINSPEEQNRSLIQHLLFELAESFLGDVRFSMYIHHENIITRYLRTEDFSKLKDFLWLKAQFHQTQWYVVSRQSKPSWRIYWWSLCWLGHKLAGHFKASQNTARAAATPVAAPPTEASIDLSEALLGQSQSRGATVVPFPGRDRK